MAHLPGAFQATQCDLAGGDLEMGHRDHAAERRAGEESLEKLT
jgi:hypothetical protein